MARAYRQYRGADITISAKQSDRIAAAGAKGGRRPETPLEEMERYAAQITEDMERKRKAMVRADNLRIARELGLTLAEVDAA